MGLNRFRTRPDPEEPLRLVTDGEERFDAYLDAGCELTGRFQFQGSVRIDGKVGGEIESAKTVVVGEHAQIRAKITADFLVVHGSVEGDVVARRKVTLTPSARVIGDVHTVGVVIEEGAKVKGCIRIGAEAEEPARSEPPEAERPPGGSRKRPARRGRSNATEAA